MNKKTYNKLLISFAIAGSLALFGLFFARSKTYQILELKALDLRFVLKGSHPADSPVVHIDIDDQSLDALGRWPWPRKYHAALTTILKECQAKQVIMDVLFTEEFKDQPQEDIIFAEALKKSDMVFLPFYFVEDEHPVTVELKNLLLKNITVSLEEAAKTLQVQPAFLKEKLPQAKKEVLDEALREVLRFQPDISPDLLLEKIEDSRGWFLFPEDENYINGHFASQQAQRLFIRKFGIVFNKDKWPFGLTYKNLNVPIKAYSEAMRGSGYINALPDIDGVTRKVALFIRHEDRVLPQVTIAALIDLLGVKQIEATRQNVILKNALYSGMRKDIVIPVDSDGAMLVNWQGRWGESFKHVPYYLILRLQDIRFELAKKLVALNQNALTSQEAAAVAYLKKSELQLLAKLTSMVKGKVCIVGLTATGTHDLRPVPMQANYPMVGTHSNLINTVLTGQFIVRRAGGIQVFLFFLAAFVIALSSLLKLWQSLLVSFVFAAGYFLAAFLVFVRFGFWIDLVGPLGITIFGFAAVTSFRYFTEEKEKLWIKQAFSHYLSQEVIGELINDPSKLKLGGERRMISVFFSDVRGFTTFSESHQPEEVVAMLNEILTDQVKIVFKYGGTLDKFVGDELMAFFGAPGNRHLNDHALVAVRTAVEIQAKMSELKDQWIKDGKDVLRIGIGINTGDMVVGNMGSAERMDYTVIGDNVNLGARLCSAAGPGEIIISEATYEPIKDHVEAEKLEPILVKGKAKPISIYKIKGMK